VKKELFELRESADLPDGQISCGLCFYFVQPRSKKYFCFSETKSLVYPPPSCPTEGRIAIVTDAGRDAVDVGLRF
jgi:hypothetical protein